mgnify:FL=1
MREAIDHNTVGYRISRARLNKGLTQKQLSEIVEVAQTYITAIERCKRNPSEELIKKIAKATGTTAEWIINGEGATPQPMFWPPENREYDIESIKRILSDCILHMPLEEAIRKGYAYNSWEEYGQESFCIYSDERKAEFFFSFVGCKTMPEQPLIAALRDFVAGAAYSSRSTAYDSKHVFVVTSVDVLNRIYRPAPLLNANASILFVDIEKKKMTAERIISMYE